MSEILAPLGGISDLAAALNTGADAVYLGLMSRYTCCRNREIYIQGFDGTKHHLLSYFLAEGSLLLQKLMAHSEKILFYLIGVTYHTALEVIAGTWHRDKRFGDTTACAALGCAHCLVTIVEHLLDALA